jgi:A/G-specific adenine glycosylase
MVLGKEGRKRRNTREDGHAGVPAQGSAIFAKTRVFAKTRALRAALLDWYRASRRDLPWRRTRDPYAVWLSEIMLQQTRVETVIPYYERFLGRFPTVHRLAEAPLGDVLAMWSGLGYYRRARMLHAAAQQVVRERGGAFPRTARELEEIRGIGRYTAGAIASIAFGEAAPLVDGNVARVLSRVFLVEDDVSAGKGLARVWRIAEELVAPEDPGAWNQALMELGATVCVPREPRCPSCPVRSACGARARGLENDLPRAKTKARVLLERRVALVATHEGRVLLGRRRTEARFGGTWEAPTLDRPEDGDPRAAFGQLLGAPASAAERRGSLTHVLSHRRLEVDVFAVELSRARTPAVDPASDYEAWAWTARDAVGGLGTSTLARRVLALGEVASAPERRHRETMTERRNDRSAPPEAGP